VPQKKTLSAFMLLFFVSLLWGTSYILIKKSLLALTPFQVATTRLFVASVFYTPVGIYHFRKSMRPHLSSFLVVGVIGSAFPAILFAQAQTQINSSLTGALASLTPLCTLILGILFFGTKSTLTRSIGIGMGLLGSLLLIFGTTDPTVIGRPVYALFIVLATLMYAFSTNVIGHKLQSYSSTVVSGVAFGLLLPVILPLFYISGVGQSIMTGELTWPQLWPVVLLSILGTIIGSVAYFYLIKRTSPVFASTVSYLAPVLAIMFGMVDGEHIYMIHLVGITILLLGIFMTRKEP